MKTFLITAAAKVFPVNYINAAKPYGITPVVVTNPENIADADALLLSGGGDANPLLYNQPYNGTPEEQIDDRRDALEMQLIQMFVQARKPILGICRGAQMLAVAFCGDLYQNIGGHTQREGRDRLHNIIINGKTVEVNSAHHQAVRDPGELKVFARAEDGVIEGVYHPSLPIVGLQWHPERHPPTGKIIFSQFAAAIANSPLDILKICDIMDK